MEQLILNVEKREIFRKKLKEARGEGKLPAVLCGSKQESLPLFVKFGDFVRVWKKAGESTVVELNLDNKIINTLIQDVDKDPVSGAPRHVDFYAVDMTKKISASVLLEFVGEPGAVKLGGTLVKVMHEAEVEALPKDLPQRLDVDVSILETFEDKILIKDIKMPSGVKVLADPDEVVAFVEEAKDEEVSKEEIKMEDIEATKEKPKEQKDKPVEEKKDEKDKL